MGSIEILENLKRLQKDIERRAWIDYAEALKKELDLIEGAVIKREDQYRYEIMNIIKELKYYIEILRDGEYELANA